MTRRFSAGMMVGSVLGAMGATMMTGNKRSRRKMMRNGRRMMTRTGEMIENVMDMVSR
jgi:gas vesicle protein